MASHGVAANSRLAEMQIKFQKKQMLEREQKKLSLIGGDHPHTTKSEIRNGKVRQMFDDRRRGIDRSHPLRPIVNLSSSATVATSNATQQSSLNKCSTGRSNVLGRSGFNNTSSAKPTSSTQLRSNFSISNGNINIYQNSLDQLDNIDNETFPNEFSTLSLNNTHSIASHVTDFENNNKESIRLGDTIIINRKTDSKGNGIKLNPVITKKSPTTAAIITPITGTASRTPTSGRVSTLSKRTSDSLKSPTTKVILSNKAADKSIKVVSNKVPNAKPAGTIVLSVKPPPRISTPPPGMALCQYCQRHFNEERLDKHEEVCRRMMTKKRKIFDASKHRVKGTEAEKYLKKGKHLNALTSKNQVPALSTVQVAKTSDGKKSNWRKKHEEFISAIREAKKVQAHLAKGGKLSDLPPPPPSENPDYIQCPHCSRRFNEAAAERHIPKCANMQHNKPKPLKKRF